MSEPTQAPKKRKTYFRNDTDHFMYMRSLKTSMRQMFKNCRRFAWTMEFLLESRQKLFGGNLVNTSPGQWGKLTAADQAEIFGYWDALHDSLMDELEHRYLINGKWYTGSEVCDRKDGTDPSRDIPSPATNSHFVFVVNTENGPEYKLYY
jgi:hypothetical protein